MKDLTNEPSRNRGLCLKDLTDEPSLSHASIREEPGSVLEGLAGRFEDGYMFGSALELLHDASTCVAYVSIRQHTSAYVSIRLPLSCFMMLRPVSPLHTLVYDALT